jgi:Fic family protein
MEDEPEPSVRAVLGHFIFVFIHPYKDGNGRIGRFFNECDVGFRGYP